MPAAPARSAEEAIVARLLAAVGSEAPAAEAARLLAPDVRCHMDRFTAVGVDAWVDWVAFIRSRGVEDVRAVVERLETGADGIVTAYGGLAAGRGAHPTTRPGAARYRVVNERVSEIWTDRWNYEIIFGASVRHPVRWLIVLIRMALWRRSPWRRVPGGPRSRPAREE